MVIVCVACAGDGNVCFYGVCYYCKPAEAACASGEMMEGSLTLWLPKWYDLVTRRHPYQRTYVEGRKARCVCWGRWREGYDLVTRRHLHQRRGGRPGVCVRGGGGRVMTWSPGDTPIREPIWRGGRPGVCVGGGGGRVKRNTLCGVPDN